MAEACDQEILRLFSKGAIVITSPSENQFLSQFFLIEKVSGGKRFILNLKDLNYYLLPPHFQLEDWCMVTQLMVQDSWMATIDLEDAYLFVPVARRSRRFLRFQCVTLHMNLEPYPLASQQLHIYSPRLCNRLRLICEERDFVPSFI